ncbi:RluA family pseudouridine synthase [Aminithiophilus ramosus]|uniref:Pseudouridine synthase n=2 Tax=Synergistales TaxID=649776 RepID=A0A9Q7ETP6_9BACT|nr:RluA family pseudouridine synthase [Aminithiophilus ramosus]QTX31193.1 RluA family pseudouridine synthase [Aminithiophilus ramosus]QVL37471.1 RluA family pseudouridine synthase [Synergistota bacterium]
MGNNRFCDDDSVPDEASALAEVLCVGDDTTGERLDLFLSVSLGVTRSFAKKLIEMGQVRPLGTGGKAKAGYRTREGERYEIIVPPPQALEIEPEAVDFDVLYEDGDILVIDKPAGLVVHPAPGHWRGTLVHGLLWRYPDIGVSNGVVRPGIVHRLDRTTSGLMVVTRNVRAQAGLIDAFRNREVDKRYLALVKGTAPVEGYIEAPIGRDERNRLRMAVTSDGREASTTFNRLWARKSCSLLTCKIHTGRTHQIRVHLRHIGCPLVGDTLYGGGRRDPLPLDRVFLHSWKLSFLHPLTGQLLAFRAPLPTELTRYLQALAARDGATP